jgi:hypothetical protein
MEVTFGKNVLPEIPDKQFRGFTHCNQNQAASLTVLVLFDSTFEVPGFHVDWDFVRLHCCNRCDYPIGWTIRSIQGIGLELPSRFNMDNEGKDG